MTKLTENVYSQEWELTCTFLQTVTAFLCILQALKLIKTNSQGTETIINNKLIL